jgi:diguanylate cyclase (GGDEF)-like protein
VTRREAQSEEVDLGLGKTRVVDDDVQQARDGARLHVLHVTAGLRSGEFFAVETPEAIAGRNATCQMRLEDHGVSRQHASFHWRLDGLWIRDLGSLNGTFVNGQRVTEQRLLVPADRIHLGYARLRYSLEEEHEVITLRELHSAVSRDHLTGVYNRRYFEQRLMSELAFCQRHAAPISLIALDVDHFKRINDEHGHPVGDLVLRAIASALLDATRTEDITARTGGEEFMVIARGTGREGAIALAQRLLNRVRELRVPIAGGSSRVTMSAGVASYDRFTDRMTPDMFVEAADSALLVAKREGRNRVHTHAATGS